MRILKMRPIAVEIGPLDRTVRLPMAARISVAMKTVCDACANPITDEYFIAGFKAGHVNMKFHEACARGEDPTWCYLCDRPKNDCACEVAL